MKHPLRTFMIWLIMIITAVAAFTLTLSLTGDTMEWANAGSGVEIDMNQDVYEISTTEDSFFWNRNKKNSTVDRKTTEEVTTAEITTEAMIGTTSAEETNNIEE